MAQKCPPPGLLYKSPSRYNENYESYLGAGTPTADSPSSFRMKIEIIMGN
jgi:hypothetical protein